MEGVWGVPQTPPRVERLPQRSPIQQRADVFFAKLQGGHMTSAQKREACSKTATRIGCSSDSVLAFRMAVVEDARYGKRRERSMMVTLLAE